MKKMKRILSLAVALAVVLAMMPAMTSAATDKSVTVTVRAQKDGAFIIPAETFTVKDGIAEEYGYKVSTKDHNNVAIDDPTEFDALVAAHVYQYGRDFKLHPTKYLDISSGFIKKAFGETANNTMTLNNGMAMNDGIKASYGNTQYATDAARLKSGDTVDFFFIQDTSYWADVYTMFDSREKTVKPGESFELNLKGYQPVYVPAGNDFPATVPIYSDSGADALTIATVDKDTGDLTTIPEKTTDKNGKVTLSFDKEGIYYISASGFATTYIGDCPITAPWCKVTVKTESKTESVQKPVTQTTGTPKKVKATSIGMKSIKVSWKKVDGAAGYKVYRSTKKTSGFKRVKTTKATSWKNTKLKTGKTYYYKVRAYKERNGKQVYSKHSNVAKAKPVPAAPMLKLTAGSNSIKATWSKVKGSNGYKLYRATSKAGKYKAIRNAKGSWNRDYTSVNKKSGKKYYFKVRAYKTVNGKNVYGKMSAVKVMAAK